MPETRCKCGHPDADHLYGRCWREPLTDRCACERYEPGTPETTTHPEVPDRIWALAVDADASYDLDTPAKDRTWKDRQGAILAAVLPGHEAMVLAKVRTGLERLLVDVRDAEPATLEGSRTASTAMGCYQRALAVVDRVARGEQP